jgi:glycosyltransferase involved in cell wall biosynthesis
LWEGFGYVIAEAMYFEKPVIAFDLSSNPELIRDGENGYLIRPGDIESVAGRIELLQKNREIIINLGKAAKESIVKNFALAKTLDEVYSFLRQKT